MSLLRANYNSPGGSKRCQAVCGNSEILLSVLCQPGGQRKAGGRLLAGPSPAAITHRTESSEEQQQGWGLWRLRRRKWHIS